MAIDSEFASSSIEQSPPLADGTLWTAFISMFPFDFSSSWNSVSSFTLCRTSSVSSTWMPPGPLISSCSLAMPDDDEIGDEGDGTPLLALPPDSLPRPPTPPVPPPPPPEEEDPESAPPLSVPRGPNAPFQSAASEVEDSLGCCGESTPPIGWSPSGDALHSPLVELTLLMPIGLLCCCCCCCCCCTPTAAAAAAATTMAAAAVVDAFAPGLTTVAPLPSTLDIMFSNLFSCPGEAGPPASNGDKLRLMLPGEKEGRERKKAIRDRSFQQA
uniref:Uncharacterized protein n=1 Tax=Anopheles dirus TaxID=7168 RepID=A0A182NXU6_9DIPT